MYKVTKCVKWTTNLCHTCMLIKTNYCTIQYEYRIVSKIHQIYRKSFGLLEAALTLVSKACQVQGHWHWVIRHGQCRHHGEVLMGFLVKIKLVCKLNYG